jgi:hypothetical protein
MRPILRLRSELASTPLRIEHKPSKLNQKSHKMEKPRPSVEAFSKVKKSSRLVRD